MSPRVIFLLKFLIWIWFKTWVAFEPLPFTYGLDLCLLLRCSFRLYIREGELCGWRQGSDGHFPFFIPYFLITEVQFTLRYHFCFPFSATDKVFLQFLSIFSWSKVWPPGQERWALLVITVQHCAFGKAKYAEERARSQLPGADNWKAQVGTKQSRRSDVGTLTLVRYPLPPSLLFKEGKEVGPLSKKALKYVLDLKTREKALDYLRSFLRFSVTWMFL